MNKSKQTEEFTMRDRSEKLLWNEVVYFQVVCHAPDELKEQEGKNQTDWTNIVLYHVM